MSEEKAPDQQPTSPEVHSPVDAHMHEIENSNAAVAEDDVHYDKHHIPFLDYSSMAMENLVGELQRLVKNESISAIKRHVDAIKTSFDQQYQALFEAKKEEFFKTYIETGRILVKYIYYNSQELTTAIEYIDKESKDMVKTDKNKYSRETG